MSKKIIGSPIVIGGKEKLSNGVVKYIGEHDGLYNYCYYKDEKSFNRHDGICYIAEAQLEEGYLIVDHAVTNQGYYETYQTIYDRVKEECEHDVNKFDDFNDDWKNEFISLICKQLFEKLDGVLVDTAILEIDMQEAFDSWVSNYSHVIKKVRKSKVYVIEEEHNDEYSIGEYFYSTEDKGKAAFRKRIEHIKENVEWIKNGLTSNSSALTEDNHTDRMVVFTDDYNYLSVILVELDEK